MSEPPLGHKQHKKAITYIGRERENQPKAVTQKLMTFPIFTRQ